MMTIEIVYFTLNVLITIFMFGWRLGIEESEPGYFRKSNMAEWLFIWLMCGVIVVLFTAARELIADWRKK